ncbi:hemolysin family protein [Akkermansiaceae bacterium]|nr:hemolysin family protein [Akkermansiaceae bacterium]
MDFSITLEGWQIALYLFGITFFLLLNAFFVAAEFAIVKVRPSQIEGVLESKPRRAGISKHVVSHLDGYLSANQLGITIGSLALGALGEPFVVRLIGPMLHETGVFSFEAIRLISMILAVVSFTFLHVVIGELLPKSIAIRKSLQTTLWVAHPLHIFYVIFRPAIWILNGTANWLLKKIFRIDPVSEGEAVHSSEELALLVEESERQQEVTETEREILINALELNDVTVKDVMTPRSEVIFLDLDKDFAENLELAIKSKHTRFPLVIGHLDQTEGLIHIKDVLRLMSEHDQDLRHIKRDLKVVPETMRLDDLLQFFLKECAQLALVVDEFGDPAGLVFMDNIMVELVGDIHDEFDEDEETDFLRISEEEFAVEGGLSLNELSDHEPAIDLESGEVSTIGGYIVQQLGHLPQPGEAVEVEGFEATVTSTDGRRIEQLRFVKLPEPETEEEEAI